ncbi:MAG: fucose isomerase [Candidatus Thorarchaeota archaeon]
MDVHIIPFFSTISPEGVKDEVLEQLHESEVSIVAPDEFKSGSDNDRNYLFIGTGGTENIVAEFLKNHNLSSPVHLLSYDLRNSLPAAMEIRSYLQREGIESKIVHATLKELGHIASEWNEFAKVLSNIENSTLGIVGQPSSWLIASHINYEKVKERWGLSTKQLPLEPLIESTKLGGETKHTAPFKQHSRSCTPSDEEIRKAGHVAQALNELVQKEKLNAVTVECFGLLMETSVSGCFALSFLNDLKESTAGCEGDIPATFTMMLGRMLINQLGFMSNVTQIDTDTNTAVFAHCTLPTSLAESYEITSHFETGLSIGIRGTMKRQPVTIFKVFGDDLSQYWVSDGEIIENLVNETGCRTQIRVKLDENVNYFLERSLANHHIIFPGHHAEKIHRFFSFA